LERDLLYKTIKQQSAPLLGLNKIVRTMIFRQRVQQLSNEDFETTSGQYEPFHNMDMARNEAKQNREHFSSEIMRRKNDEPEYRSFQFSKTDDSRRDVSE